MKHFINMRIMIIATVAIFMTAVSSTFVYYSVFQEEVHDNLRTCCRLLSQGTSMGDPAALSQTVNQLDDDGIRVTLISKEGNVLYDNVAEVNELDNHLDREEIKEAIKNGEGHSVRRSSTINRTNYYYAIRLDNGSILRTSRESHSIINIFWHALPVVILSIFLLLIICYFTSRFLTEKILEPVEAIAENMDHPEEIETYEELEPIIALIQTQHQDIMEHAKLRQEFTANVSHELKTPLAAISGYSELIESGLTGEKETRKFSGEIHKSANRLLTLINDILRLSEFDVSSGSEYSMEDLDLYDIAVKCGEMLEVSAGKHQVSLTVEGEPTMIHANQDMMEDLVYNLCDNAIRYNKPGGYVKVRVKDSTLEVEDNGIGIPEEYQSRVFERFFRVDKSRSKKTGGTGLGLAIVKHIATIHHADLALASSPEKGTLIRIRFS